MEKYKLNLPLSNTEIYLVIRESKAFSGYKNGKAVYKPVKLTDVVIDGKTEMKCMGPDTGLHALYDWLVSNTAIKVPYLKLEEHFIKVV